MPVTTTGPGTNIISDAALADAASLTAYTDVKQQIILASAPTAGGTGYTVGDTLTITVAGGTAVTCTVLTINAGIVLTVSTPATGFGSGYTAGTGKATTGGTGGNDCTVNITNIVSPPTLVTVKSVTLAPINSGVGVFVSGKVDIIDGTTVVWSGRHGFLATATSQSDSKYLPVGLTFCPITNLTAKYTNITNATTASVTLVYSVQN